MKNAKDYYSKNVADAIRQACADFGVSQEHLDIEVVETGSAGIFGLCRKRAHIRAGMKQVSQEAEESPEAVSVDRKEPEGKEAAPRKTAARKPSEKGGHKGRRPERVRTQPEKMEPLEPPSQAVLDLVKADLDRILELMGFPSATTVAFESDAIRCRIEGDHAAAIVGEDGRSLDSLQYLLRKMSGSDLPERMMIDINAGDFRERREDELKKQALELAEMVKADGRTQAIPALNPSERRVVHVALQDDKAIRSRSVGDGLFKKVLIYKPGAKGRKMGGKQRGRQGGGSADK